jgi:hypothetical protein
MWGRHWTLASGKVADKPARTGGGPRLELALPCACSELRARVPGGAGPATRTGVDHARHQHQGRRAPETMSQSVG